MHLLEAGLTAADNPAQSTPAARRLSRPVPLAVPKLPASRGGVLALARAVWQRHKRTTYIVCGSERGLLRQLVTSERSPFFQHFDFMELGSMKPQDAMALLQESGPPGRTVPAAVARQAVEILGGHPFYLQLFGEVLTAGEPPYDVGLVRQVFSELLFTRTGRLSLYFAREFDRLVGTASTLASTLEALADGPLRTMEIARKTGGSSGGGALPRAVGRRGGARRAAALGAGRPGLRLVAALAAARWRGGADERDW